MVPWILLCLLLTLFIPRTGNSIERIFRINNEPTEGNSVFPLDDGYLVLTNHNGKQNFTKFGLLGEVLFCKDFFDAAGGWPHSAIQTSDDDYLIAGLINNPRPQKAYLIKLDENLNFQWGRKFTHMDPTLDMWIAGIKEITGGYLVLVKGQMINFLTNNPFFGIVKINFDGDLVWQKKIDVGVQTEVFDIYEISSGYVIYGAIEHRVSDWDLYLGAIDKDGENILWQFVIGGNEFDGACSMNSLIYPHASNIVQVDADHLVVAAYTKSYGANPESGDGVGKSILLLMFPTEGNAYTAMKMIDGPMDDQIAGPFGGPNLIRLSDGNLLLGGYTNSTWSDPYSSNYPGAFLVKLTPDLSAILWQDVHLVRTGKTRWEPGLVLGLSESLSDEIGVTGKTDEEAFFFTLSPNGVAESGCTVGFPANLSLSTVTPTVGSLVDFTLGEGLVALTSISSSTSDAAITLVCYSTASISPSPLDRHFGELKVGNSSAPFDITISNENTANGTLIISAIHFLGEDKGDFTRSPGTCETADYTLEPMDSCKISVAFSPKSTGEKSTTIEIITNDPDHPRWIGRIRGTGVAGQGISINPTNVPFGEVRVGDTSDQTVNVRNSGTVDLHLGAIGSPAAPFIKTGGTCANGKTLAPGGSCTIILRFQPTNRGPFNSSFAISSDDPNQGSLIINLSGKGAQPDVPVTAPDMKSDDPDENTVPVTLSGNETG